MRRNFWCSISVGLGLLLSACGGDDPVDEPAPEMPVVDMSHLEGLPGIVPAWEPGGDSFYRVPWPSDVRLTGD